MEVKSVDCTASAWWFYNDWTHCSEYPESSTSLGSMAECWAAPLISSLCSSWDCFCLLSFTAYCFSNSSNVCLSLDSWDLSFWSYSPLYSLPGNPLWVGCVRKHRLISIFILFTLTKEEAGCWEGVSGHCSGLSISMEKQEEEGAGYTSVLSL